MSHARTPLIAAAAVLAATFGFGVAEARPSMSLGQQSLSISFDECKSREVSAYNNAGWTDVVQQSNWAKGHKDQYASYMTCTVESGGTVAVIMFVCFDGNDPDGSLAGGERIRLQNLMDPSANK